MALSQLVIYLGGKKRIKCDSYHTPSNKIIFTCVKYILKNSNKCYLATYHMFKKGEDCAPTYTHCICTYRCTELQIKFRK